MAGITNRGSAAVGKSLYECTATSTTSSAMASRRAAVKTPTPICSTGAADWSPAVVTITSSASCPLARSASRIPPAWVVANRLPRVPIRIMDEPLGRRQSRLDEPLGRRQSRLDGPGGPSTSTTTLYSCNSFVASGSSPAVATASTVCGSSSKSSRNASA
ncbi:Uncharacterised protein [Mycobacteroides abscessus subsp. abscessus]|nr:Uncharacterised protein [Mycobacteroides abscessus subsp. abscessus]